MRLNVSAWSIRQPIPALALFMVLMVLGWMSFSALPVTRFPNIDIPIVTVAVTQSGAAPAELETQVTKKIEDAVAGVTGVKHITSSLIEGASTTTIEFRLEIDPDRALNDVKDAIARIRPDLPRTIDEPITQRVDVEGLPILTYAARAPAMTVEELSWFVDDTAIRALQGVKGVSKVERVGGVEREIRISLDPDRLLSHGITAGEVNRQVRATNVDLAGGRGEIAGREQAIRTLAGARSVEELAGTVIPLPGGRHVRLDQLGAVTDAYEEQRTFAEFNGDPVVALSITRGKGASDVQVAKEVEKKIAELRAAHPDIELKKIDTFVDYTYGVYEATMISLLEGAALAILVVFLFLRDIRATLIAAIALPLSIVPAFWAMDAMGFSLNLVSLLAITIVVGILVDDAIVEIENIVRHMRMGKSPYRAALEAADEIGLAVIAITFTIIAVFAPVSFMGGIAGQYFKQFGLVVAAAVFFSLLVARLVTPLLAAYFLRANPKHVDREGWLLRTYTRLVGWSVRHRIATVILGCVVFAGSLVSTMLLPGSFLPQEDVGRTLLALELPPGSRLEDTRAVVDTIVERVRQRPDVKSVFVDGGRVLGQFGTGEGGQVRQATLTIRLVPKEERTLSQEKIEREIGRDLARVPDIRAWFVRENGQRDFQIVLLGRDGAAVDKAAADLASQMKRLPELLQVVSTAELDRPELRVRPKADLAAERGVTTDQISEAVRIATIGDVGANLAKFDVGDRQVPIRVQLDPQARENRQLIEALRVPTASGAAVPLSSVADFELAQGPTSIDRYDRARRVMISANLLGNTALGDALAKVQALPAARQPVLDQGAAATEPGFFVRMYAGIYVGTYKFLVWLEIFSPPEEKPILENGTMPAGVTLAQFGDAEIMTEVFQSFGDAMAAGLMMVFAVLVLLFSSFLQPITILASLPFSLGGAIIALVLTSKPISLPVVIGILMLMGIVTKNAIMLVDFAVEEIAKGIPRTEAIIDAGRKRARPIVMTTIAMVGGMLPSALGLDSGGEFRSPMAIAVIGGLISSTMLSLIFVPAVFVLMDDFSNLIRGIFGRFVGPKDEPGTAVEHPTESVLRAAMK